MINQLCTNFGNADLLENTTNDFLQSDLLGQLDSANGFSLEVYNVQYYDQLPLKYKTAELLYMFEQ